MLTFNSHFTDYCNYNCKYCFVKKEQNEMSLSDIKKIVDKLAIYAKDNNETVRINLAGGEPLLSKNINSIIDYIYNKGMKVSIITNGYYLTKEFLLNNKDKLYMIGISVDSLDINTNKNIGRCSNNKTLSNDNLIFLCDLIKQNGIKPKINHCVSKFNYGEDIRPFIDVVKPDRIKILRVMTDHLGLLKSVALSDKEWDKVIDRYKNIKNVCFEDNEYMRKSYLIIDSFGNLSKNNLHITDNSLLDKSVEGCLSFLDKRKEDTSDEH